MKRSSLPYCLVDFEDEDSVSRWLDYAEDIGLDGVELMYSWPVNWHVIHRTHKLLSRRRLKVSMITTHCDPAQFSSDLRRLEAQKLVGYVDLATDFECSFVRVLAGRFDPTWRETSVSKALDAVVQTFELVLPYAKKNGVVLALENHPGFGVHWEIVAELLQRISSPSFGWNFDMENAYRVDGQTAFDFLKNTAIVGRLVHVHAKNFGESPDGWDSNVALDEGVNDVRAMLAYVKATGYDDWISIEFAGQNREKLKRSAKYLRDVWEQLL